MDSPNIADMDIKMRVLYLLIIFLLLAGCNSLASSQEPVIPTTDLAAVSNPAPEGAQPQALPEATPTPEDVFEIYAWVNKPEPKPGEVVTVSGSLIKNGVYLGGVPMWTFWPDENGGNVPHNCVSYMAYQRGLCMIEVKDYPVDVYVPVSIKIYYQDMVFTTETGFTPRGN